MENSVGIDISKRTLEIVRLSKTGKPERINLKTNAKGRMQLINWLKSNDVVIMEAGNQAFSLARQIEEQSEAKAVVLDPRKVLEIAKSMKKTDKSDALILAKLGLYIPLAELPVIATPGIKTEDQRRLCTEQAHWTNLRTKSINRLHSIFVQAGLTEITKKHLKTTKSRKISLALLPDRFKVEANRILSHVDLIEATLMQVDGDITENLKANIGYTELVTSMPGIGPKAAFALLSFVGNCERFTRNNQIGYYSGLVPKVELSGQQKYYGNILRTGCQPIRRVMVQCAWAMVRSKHSGEIGSFFQRLKSKKGSKIAIVATARKMLETLCAMIKNGEFYRFMPDEVHQAKLKSYGLILK